MLPRFSVWVGESGGLGGVYTVERNIFANFTQAGQCGGGEYSQAGASLCYRSLQMVATSTMGELLNATVIRGQCANASAPPAAKKGCIDPAWYGFSDAELAAPLLTSVNANIYSAPLDPRNSSLNKLRPDIDTRSIGGVSDPGFVRTPYSQWWNRTHLDYKLAPTSPAFKPSIGFRPTDLTAIGLRPEWHALFDGARKGSRPGFGTIQSESADRAFGLYLEPSFGISFPTNPGTLAPTAATAFAKFGNVDFGARGAVSAGNAAAKRLQLRMRACIPAAGSKTAAAAAAAVLRDGAPDGPVVATVKLDANAAHPNCGYLIGSYWAPGVLNDDPAAMTELVVTLEPEVQLTGRRDLYLSVEGGGHAAIDWFRFE